MIKLLLILCLMISPALAADNPLEQAKKKMQSGNYADALNMLRHVVAEEENNYEAWFLLGVAQVHEQQEHQAIEAFRHVISLRPKLAEPHNNLAAVYNNLGDTKAAIQELEIALDKRPTYAIAEENIADLHIKLALQYYRNILNNNANEAVRQRYSRLLKVRNPVASPDDVLVAMTATQSTKPIVSDSDSKQKITPILAIIASDDTYAQAQVVKKKIEPELTLNENKSITGVLDALEAWRTAWSSQHLDDYFSSYADSFDPGARFASMKAWRDYKKRVIKNKAFIHVELDQVEVDISESGNVAIISMMQDFKSNTYKGKGRKQIAMKYMPDGWKIIAEVALP
ncbi:MAG: tetratricopeptide repeat protein [Ghiorsea sp.]|nr:tetratricopeptide repeat protein [Ghiorsea sp.]